MGSGNAQFHGGRRFHAMDLDDDESCTITDETSAFSITDIELDTNGYATITWTSCSDHIYGVFSSTDLSNWVGITAMWGDDWSTSWTDTNTVAGNVTNQFYKVVRIPPDEGYNGDAIPSGWTVDNGLNPLDPNLDIEDPDNDFWSNLGEYQNGTNPTDSNSLAVYGFTLNSGTDVVSTTSLHIDLLPGLVADFIIVSEDIRFDSSVTNTFSTGFDYSLTNTNDGLHTLFLKLLKTDGTTSPMFGETVEVDRNPPTMSITSPTNGVTVSQRRLNIEGFAADASTTNAAVSDASRALLVTVNGDFVNDRDTNGLWWSAQDLAPGTNTFVAIAVDRAGLAVTNSIWLVYDSTLATNVPVFTVDITNTVTVGSNATSLAISGTIDDDNATIEIDVLDALDNTVTNATVSAAIHGTNWWAEIPVMTGNNLVFVSAANAGSAPATNSFTMIQSTNTFLEIDSPAADTEINATNVLVVGRASGNFNGAITINGITANTSLDADGNFTFSNSVPLNSVDANAIEVDATGADGSSATTRQTVYGYEVMAFQHTWPYQWQHLGGDCWYSNHYPDAHNDHGNGNEVLSWTAPSATYSDVGYDNTYGSLGALLDGESWSHTWTWNPDLLPTADTGQVQFHSYQDGKHLDAGNAGNEFTDCPYDHDCTVNCPDGPDCQCHDLLYCIGDTTDGCCIDSKEEEIDIETPTHETIFVKHWPTDEEQTVILHFKNFYYYRSRNRCDKNKVVGTTGLRL